MLRGYESRRDTAREIDAWKLMHLVQPHCKKRITMRIFLDKTGKSDEQVHKENVARSLEHYRFRRRRRALIEGKNG